MSELTMNKDRIKKNIFFTFLSQFCFLLFSVIMSLILPKLVGVTQFSYWQLFIFYSSYVGFGHLGITDGIYLKIGGKSIDNLEKDKLSSNFWYMIFIQIIIFLIICLFAFNYVDDSNRQFVLFMTGIYLIFANANWFMEFVFQATDDIKTYSFLTIASRLYFMIFLFADIFLRNGSFIYFVEFFVLSQVIASFYGLYKLRKTIFSLTSAFFKSISEVFNTAKSGIKVTIANTVSILILGIGQFAIDDKWGINSFGKLSFAFSLTTFILQFVSQFSLVFFPALRKVDRSNRKKFFKSFHRILNCILPMVLIFYIPIKIIMDLWMPQYSISFYWLSFLLPICIFDGKMNMLFSVSFKVEREENKLLRNNVISLIISFVLIMISVYVIQLKTLVPVSITIAIFFRSYLSEYGLSLKFKDFKSLRKSTLEIIYVILYYALIFIGNYFIIFVGTTILYLLLCFDKNVFKEMFKVINGKLTKRQSNNI